MIEKLLGYFLSSVIYSKENYDCFLQGTLLFMKNRKIFFNLHFSCDMMFNLRISYKRLKEIFVKNNGKFMHFMMF